MAKYYITRSTWMTIGPAIYPNSITNTSFRKLNAAAHILPLVLATQISRNLNWSTMLFFTAERSPRVHTDTSGANWIHCSEESLLTLETPYISTKPSLPCLTRHWKKGPLGVCRTSGNGIYSLCCQSQVPTKSSSECTNQRFPFSPSCSSSFLTSFSRLKSHGPRILRDHLLYLSSAMPGIFQQESHGRST